MTTPRFRLRRWLKIAALAGLVVFVGMALARRQLVHAAVNAVLELAGASEVKLSVSHASPWRVVLDDVQFRYRTRPFGAERVSFQRAHWWTPSLGAVRIEKAWLPWHLDGSDTNPVAWATYQGGRAKIDPILPAEQISLDGTIVVKAAALPDQQLTVRVEAAQDGDSAWAGTVEAEAPGLHLAGEAGYRPAEKDWRFRIAQARVDLKPWQDFLQRLVVLPGGAWEIEGVVTAEVAGGRVDGKMLVNGTVALRDGRLANPERKVAATGVEFDVEFEDFDAMRSKPGNLRVAQLKAAAIDLRQMTAEFAFASAEQVRVSALAFQTLGGRVSAAEPFNLFLDQRELETVVLLDGLELAEILALAKEVPASATGRVDGRIPLSISEAGVRFGTGWLALEEGSTAELRLKAAGLLTRGSDPRSPAFPVLQKVESGLLQLRVSELRMDLYPPNRPPGRSATLHIAGTPADPAVKAPVVLDLNVNGPVEKLLNMGLDSRLEFGGKP